MTQYETKRDRTRQQIAKKAVEDAEGCRIIDGPDLALLDWSLEKGGTLCGYGEYKRRHISMKHPMIAREGIMLSEKKYKQGMKVAELQRVPLYFYVQAEEGLFRAKLRYGYEVKMGGRTTQTRRPEDIENVVMIPTDEFEEVK
jgi:hypothetical protein